MSESSNNKRIAKNTLMLYIRMLFTMGVSLYTSRVILQTLGAEDFGIYNVVGGVVTMFTFINNAMSNATMRFMTFVLGSRNNDKLQQVFNTSILIHALISLIILILAETIGLWFLNTHIVIPVARTGAAHWVFQMSVISTIVMIMSVPYNATIIAHERMSAFAYISVLEVILKLACVYILFIGNYDKLKLYAILILIVQILIRIIYSLYCRKHFNECKFRLKLDISLFKEMVSFAVWSLFGNLAGVASTQGVNILLNIFFGPVVNAARGIAVQAQNAIQSLVNNFQTALNPQIIKTYANKEMEQMHSLVFASGRYSFFLLLFISLPIIIEIKPILSFWLGIVPEHTENFIRLSLFIAMVDALVNPLTTSMQATGRIKVYQIIIGSILLLILPISYLILKLGGVPEMVYIVYFIMTIISLIIRLLMIRPIIQISLRKYFFKVVLKITLVVIVATILPIFVDMLLPQDTLISFLIVCATSVISILLSVFFLGLEKVERLFVIAKINVLKEKISLNEKNKY